MAQGRDTITETMAKALTGAKRSGHSRPRRGAHVRFDLKRGLSIFAVLPSLLCFPAEAAKWDIVPTLSVTETYTDNVLLTQNALKQGDWVTEINPAISVAATGARL